MWRDGFCTFLRYLVLISALLITACSCSTTEVPNKAAEKVPEGSTFVVLAGGCFWCMEPPYEKLDGVYSVVSGYAGGKEVSPSYQEVAGKKTSHVEAVKITYDDSKVSFRELIEIYWKQVDPTDLEGQFVDRGSPYKPVIFYQNDEEMKIAEESKRKLNDSNKYDKSVVVPIVKYTTFYPAEEYHQDYYKKNPLRYKYYRSNSGRDQFLEKIWGK